MPMIVVEVDGIKCHVLLDTGVGSPYASAALFNCLNKQPICKQLRRIEMMMQSSNKIIKVHKLKINNLKGDSHLETEVTKVKCSALLSLENPMYKKMIEQFSHLEGITMDDVDEKAELPVHLILGASEYTRIKTMTKPKTGQPGEPVTEQTQFGWTLMSPGKKGRLIQYVPDANIDT